MKKTLALLALCLLSGCEDWKLDMVGDHQDDDDYYDTSHRSGSSCPSSDEAQPPPSPPAMLPPASPGSSTSDGGMDDDTGARTSQCEGSSSLCEYQITEASCEAWTECTWIPK